MPVDLGLGILVGILCLHTPLILNQTTAATTKIKGSYYMNYMIGRKLSFFKACSQFGDLTLKAQGSGNLVGRENILGKCFCKLLFYMCFNDSGEHRGRPVLADQCWGK